MTALVDVPTYQRVTKDTTSASGDVTTALADAQTLVGNDCRRTFDYGTYTETLDVWRNGVVYPAARPVDTVTSPANASLRLGGIYVGPIDPVLNPLSPLPPQTTVTYSGGYHPFGSGTSPECPVKLARVIARIAYLMLHPFALQGAPAGATSVAVGDVSVHGDLSVFMISDPSIERDLARYRRRPAAQLTQGWA